MDGWNRIDAFNILANPFTTTRPKVTLGERQQFTQIDEPFTDEFLLGDFNLSYDIGDALTLTSVTSYTDRDVLVVRDATALTASITGGIDRRCRRASTRSTRRSTTPRRRKAFTQELRLAGRAGPLQWVAGIFYTRLGARLQPEPAGVRLRRPLQGRQLRSAERPPDRRNETGEQGRAVQLRPALRLHADRHLRRGDLAVTDRFDLTGGLRYYDFEERPHPDLRRHLRRPERQRRRRQRRRLRAARHRQLQAERRTRA